MNWDNTPHGSSVLGVVHAAPSIATSITKDAETHCRPMCIYGVTLTRLGETGRHGCKELWGSSWGSNSYDPAENCSGIYPSDSQTAS